jgi:hypothetical protein
MVGGPLLPWRAVFVADSTRRWQPAREDETGDYVVQVHIEPGFGYLFDIGDDSDAA